VQPESWRGAGGGQESKVALVLLDSKIIAFTCTLKSAPCPCCSGGISGWGGRAPARRQKRTGQGKGAVGVGSEGGVEQTIGGTGSVLRASRLARGALSAPRLSEAIEGFGSVKKKKRKRKKRYEKKQQHG